MNDKITYSLTVKPEHIDFLHHVNNVCYVQWMQDAGLAHSNLTKWTVDYCISQGIAWVARKHEIDYMAPALEGDEIDVLTWVEGSKYTSCKRRYSFIRKRDGAILAEAYSIWVLIDLKTTRPTPIPEDMKRDFAM